MSKSPFIFPMILLMCGCTSQDTATLDEALTLYRENKLVQALPLFQQTVKQHKDHAEPYAWLAETYRRLGDKYEAVKAAERALELEPCNSFAHIVIADACHLLPLGVELTDSDTSWIHINKAVECDSADGNAWAFLCGEAMIREKYDVMRKSARKMKETGFLTRAVLDYGRWSLSTLPENAILITNGDMDTFPLLALQTEEGLRTDVAVIEKQWLGLPQYLGYLGDYYDIPLPVEDSLIDSLGQNKGFPENMLLISEKIFKGWLEQKARDSFPRPIAIAVTVTEDFYTEVKDHFQYTGPFLLWQPGPASDTPDTMAIKKSLAGIQPDDFTGPWVSEGDRSPIRRLYTKYIVKNVTQAALVYSQEMIKAKKFKDAKRMLSWAEAFERKTELGPVYTEQITQLKAAAEKR